MRVQLALTRRVLTVSALTLAAAGALLGLGRHTRAADDKPAPKAALTVTLTGASQRELPLLLKANGNVMAWQEAVLGSESNGLRMAEVRVNVGDAVKKGQVLAVFADEAVQTDLAQAKAALLEAQAMAQDAAANAARARSLQKSGMLSPQATSQQLTAEQAAAARVEAAKAAVTAAELRLKYTRVLAPDDGLISARSATVGAVVGTGTELFRLVRQGRLEWRAEVTASELARIKPGDLAEVTAADGSKASGKVRVVAPTVDTQTRNAIVYVDLPASSYPAFKAGMFATGQFALGASNAQVLPQQAVVLRDGFSYVFVMKPDQHVAQTKVQVGRRSGDTVEILTGLAASAKVVSSGAGFLKDGDLVRVTR